MHIKESFGSRLFDFINKIAMFCFVILMVYPMLHILFASFSESNKLMMHSGIMLRPLGFSTQAYKMVFVNPMIKQGYLNTLLIVVVGVTINIIVTGLGAYFLSRRNVLWRNHVMIFIMFTMFFSGGTIPFYFTVKNLGLDNSLWALMLPTAVNTFNLVIMRTSMAAIPESLEEAAKLDGAGHLRILVRIIIPLSMPVIAVMILYYAVEKWNSWFHAMIFIKDREKLPLQIILREILIQNDTTSMSSGVSVGDQQAIGESIKNAVIIVATVPILCIYPFLQKYFVKGVMIGAVKG